MKDFGKKEDKTKEREKRPVTARYLENAATYYLGRYASCAENLARVLERKVRRRNEGHSAPSAEQTDWIEATVAKFVRLGLVNDTEYALTRTFSLHRSGKSERVIRGTLKQKGVGDADINAALDALREEKGDSLELEAAIAYARRRRFGPYRTSKPGEDKVRRELASFARAGFSYQLARMIVEASDIERLSALVTADRSR